MVNRGCYSGYFGFSWTNNPPNKIPQSVQQCFLHLNFQVLKQPPTFLGAASLAYVALNSGNQSAKCVMIHHNIIPHLQFYLLTCMFDRDDKMCVCVCVCVSERERERERESSPVEQ